LTPLVFGWTISLNIQYLELKLNVKIFENLKPKDRKNEGKFLFYLKTMHVQKVLIYSEKYPHNYNSRKIVSLICLTYQNALCKYEALQYGMYVNVTGRNSAVVHCPLMERESCMCVCGVSIFSPKIREIYGGMRGEGKGL
jgi:hypothetical protein